MARSEDTGDQWVGRKTVVWYLISPEEMPPFGQLLAKASMLDGFKPYIEERLKAGVWNAQVLVRELPAGNAGGAVAQTAAHSSKPVLQCPRMPEPDASKAVLTLLNVLVDGSGPEGSMVLNRNDPGLLKSLSLVSAEQASAIAPSGGSSIAAHVDHLRYLLELLNRWSRGEPDVFENAAFGTSWTRSTVSAEEWAARCEALAREAHAWARAIDRPAARNGPGIDVVIASAVHLAYHLGAMRQINGLLRGPAARD